MKEVFLIKTVGGPHEGVRESHRYQGWPLPNTLVCGCHKGWYMKVSESQLPVIEPGVLLRRGAEYKWHPVEQG